MERTVISGRVSLLRMRRMASERFWGLILSILMTSSRPYCDLISGLKVLEKIFPSPFNSSPPPSKIRGRFFKFALPHQDLAPHSCKHSKRIILSVGYFEYTRLTCRHPSNNALPRYFRQARPRRRLKLSPRALRYRSAMIGGSC